MVYFLKQESAFQGSTVFSDSATICAPSIQISELPGISHIQTPHVVFGDRLTNSVATTKASEAAKLSSQSGPTLAP